MAVAVESAACTAGNLTGSPSPSVESASPQPDKDLLGNNSALYSISFFFGRFRFSWDALPTIDMCRVLRHLLGSRTLRLIPHSSMAGAHERIKCAP